MTKQIFAIAAIYFLSVIGWLILGGTIEGRTNRLDAELREKVGQLWGTPLSQGAPVATLGVPRTVETQEVDKATGRVTLKHETVVDQLPVPIVGSDLRIGLHLDQRQKGLLWYATYRAELTGRFVLESQPDKTGDLTVTFRFPADNGQYDDFRIELVPEAAATPSAGAGAGPAPSPSQAPAAKPATSVPFQRGADGVLFALVPAAAPASRYVLSIHYVSQGLDSFTYRFADRISEARDFQLVATTDFDGYDFPGNTMSPTEKAPLPGGGYALTWRYKSLVTGNGIGVAMPHRLNPGPLAARIAFFAPVSLGFFFFLTFVLSILRGLRIHPMNYFFIAGAFFAFHLLLAYLVDQISVHLAFAVCSAVSIFLLLSYLRIVVGARRAFFEFALAQAVYLVGFSYAFFFEGFTGLTVTIGAIVTLFVVMQLTARIDWAEKFK